jgi:hypothetical protein
MAERCVVVTWGAPVAGREERGLEVFNEAIGFYGKCQAEGRIESFDICLLTPNAGMNGCITLKGSVDQLNTLKEDDDYRRILTDANLVVKNLCVVDGATDEGIGQMVQTYQEAVSRVPQTA